MKSASVGPFTEKNHGNGPEENLEIRLQGPVIDVIQVQQDHFVERNTRAAADLPQPGETGFCLQTLLVPFLVMVEFVEDRRARSDDAHVP